MGVWNWLRSRVLRFLEAQQLSLDAARNFTLFQTKSLLSAQKLIFGNVYILVSPNVKSWFWLIGVPKGRPICPFSGDFTKLTRNWDKMRKTVRSSYLEPKSVASSGEYRRRTASTAILVPSCQITRSRIRISKLKQLPRSQLHAIAFLCAYFFSSWGQLWRLVVDWLDCQVEHVDWRGLSRRVGYFKGELYFDGIGPYLRHWRLVSESTNAINFKMSSNGFNLRWFTSCCVNFATSVKPSPFNLSSESEIRTMRPGSLNSGAQVAQETGFNWLTSVTTLQIDNNQNENGWKWWTLSQEHNLTISYVNSFGPEKSSRYPSSAWPIGSTWSSFIVRQNVQFFSGQGGSLSFCSARIKKTFSSVCLWILWERNDFSGLFFILIF